VLATGLATYPELSMVCGDLRSSPQHDTAVIDPSLLVEVLSDGTGRYDLGEKFAQYRHLAPLEDYVLVSQHMQHLEVYARDGDHWALRIAETGQTVALTALDGEPSVDRVYAGIELNDATPNPPR
jgi:Uma2 family endonuclease